MQSRNEQIATVAEKSVTYLFVLMLNPKFRGEGFDFRTFDIEDHVEGTSGLSFAKPLNKNEIQQLRKLSRFVWDELVRRSDVINWIDSQKKSEDEIKRENDIRREAVADWIAFQYKAN